MKKILAAIIIATTLFSCRDKEKKVVHQEPTKQDTIKIKNFTDPELVDTSMDNATQRVMMARRKPKPPRPGEPPVPPVTKTGNGCILIDPNGETVSGTMWNVNGDIVCAGSGMTDEQLQNAITLVRSYYGFEDSLIFTFDENVFNSYPQNKRRRIILTTTNWYCNNCGGVAYINSFGWFDNSPGFVFTALLGTGNTKWIADAIAHESGHTFGLRHHSDWLINPDSSCVFRGEYLWGDLIMGASYYSPSPRFDIAPNSLGCTVIQDDKKIITTTVRQ